MEVYLRVANYTPVVERQQVLPVNWKMLLTPFEEISLDREKHEQYKDNIMILNIPIGGKKQVSPEKELTGNKASLLSSKYDESIEIKLRDLKLSDVSKSDEEDSESSDDEELLDKESLVAKCPDRKKDTKKIQIKNATQPYPQVHRMVPQYTNIGGLICVPSFVPPDSDLLPQIPQPVEDFGRDEASTTNENLELVNDLLNQLKDKERQLLNNSLDQAIAETSVQKQCLLQPTRLDESCCSPDSGYGNMSPPSIPPSPSTQALSLYSPNPRFESRNSDSDSGESEPHLAPVETSYYKLPLVNCIYVAPLQTSRPAPTAFRTLLPDSVQVDLVGIEKPAIDRLQEKKLLKNALLIDVEWVMALMEAKPLLPNGSNSAVDCLGTKYDLRKKFIELLKSGPRMQNFYEKIYCRVKLYKKKGCEDILVDKELTTTSPLYIAALNCNDCPLVARLIIDILKPKESYDANGNSLLHHLAEKGDTHAQVLAELLYSKTFNVNHTNNLGETALHKAVKCHAKRSSLACVKQFIKHGASLMIQDFDRNTALHLAVCSEVSDPCQLIRALLMSNSANEAINLWDKHRNTALHVAASRNDLPLEKHKDLLSQLINSQARHDLRNEKERLALSFVAENRKSDMKYIFNRRIY